MNARSKKGTYKEIETIVRLLAAILGMVGALSNRLRFPLLFELCESAGSLEVLIAHAEVLRCLRDSTKLFKRTTAEWAMVRESGLG